MASPQLENGYLKISLELWEALYKIRIPGETRQMLDFIIRKTYGYHKKEDQISTSQFAEAIGLPNFTIHKSRRKLLDMNLITVTKKGNSQILTYSFQKDYDKWKPLPKKVTVTKKGNYCNQKRSLLLPKKVTNCSPKSDTQKIITKDNITKDNTIVAKNATIEARDYFYLKFEEKTKTKYIPDFAKDGKIFKDVLGVSSLETIKNAIDLFFESDDEFILKAGFTTGVFRTQINKLAQSKKESASALRKRLNIPEV